MVTLVVEYPRGRAERSLGEELDEFLEKELDVRIYSRYIGLSNLQAVAQSLTLMEERMAALRKDNKEQEKAFKRVKNINEKNKRKEDELERRIRNLK